MPSEFTHLNAHGHAAMVDVTGKPPTHRKALTSCKVVGIAHSMARLRSRNGENIIGDARLAGLAAAKQTSALIPLCHPLPLTGLDLSFALRQGEVEISATTETVGQTGVEMEALTACAVAALSVIASIAKDDPLASMEELTLWEKSGGRSGTWTRSAGGEVTNEPTT